MNKNILIAGESWVSYTTHIKGVDAFYTSVYEEGVSYLRSAIESFGHSVTYVPNHLAQNHLPYTVEEYAQYDVIILSDIGSNTLMLPSDTFIKSIPRPNRCAVIKEYVLKGGALMMIGGYLSFSGVDAKARYGATPIQDVLPVECLEVDDRREHAEGVRGKILKEHQLTKGIVGQWPILLGYNRTLPKSGCDVVVEIEGDPLIAAGNFGKGRSAVFCSDCSPHWAPPEFLGWKHYPTIWKNMLEYLINDKT